MQYESTTVTPQLHTLKETGTQLPCNLPQLHHYLIAVKTRDVYVHNIDPITNQNTPILVTQVLDQYLNTNRKGTTSTGLPFHSRGVYHHTEGDHKKISKEYSMFDWKH